MSKLNVHIETWDEVAARVADVWHRAEGGEDVVPSHHVSFASWEALAAVMTPKRLDLLRHLHRRPAASIAALARDLGRDYRRVHGDVEALVAAGLIDRGADGLRAEYAAIQADIAL